VFAYRFDWDEEDTVLGYDLSVALGAAHAMELPFLWDFFELFPMDGLFPETPERDALARSIRDYWGRFAHEGDPGTGSQGGDPRWEAWGTGGNTFLVLDTPADGGIRMATEQVTLAGVARQLAEDPSVDDDAERCSLFRWAFLWSGAADEARLAPYCAGRPGNPRGNPSAGTP